MITAERLKELIKSNASVYDFIEEQYVPLNSTCFVDEKVGVLYWFKEDFKDDDWVYPLEDLFETKEEAEWEFEFGNITRTETLRLPTWEDMQNKIQSNGFGNKVIANFDSYVFEYKKSLNLQVVLGINLGSETLYYGDLTKENYTEACRLAKKLFLGEKQ